MSAWLKRFGLHLAAAVGATGVFVTAAAVGAHRTQPQASLVATAVPVVRTRSPVPQGTPTVVLPERSLAGTIKAIDGDTLDVIGVGGREWHVAPEAGALIRLNGKAARLEQLQPGEKVVILGRAQPGPGARFIAHAITAKTN